MEDWPDFFTGQEGILNNSQYKQGGRLPCPNKTRRKADQLTLARQVERFICFLCKIGWKIICKEERLTCLLSQGQEERLTFFLCLLISQRRKLACFLCLKVHKHEIILNFFLTKIKSLYCLGKFSKKISLLFLRFSPEFRSSNIFAVTEHTRNQIFYSRNLHLNLEFLSNF